MSKLEDELKETRLLLLQERLLRLRDSVGFFLSTGGEDKDKLTLRLKKLKEDYDRAYLD